MFPGSDHAKQRLADDEVAWLTTVSAERKPSTAPIWFLLEPDDTILLFSLDPSVRAANVRANSRVTLALNSDPRGADIVVVNGTAAIDHAAPSASHHAGYLAKYGARMADHDWTPAWFETRYRTAIRITITSITGR